METLPPEIKMCVLLLSSSRDLVPICSADRIFYSLCADPYFWRSRFEREGFPLPRKEPTGPWGWLKIHRLLVRSREEDLPLGSLYRLEWEDIDKGKYLDSVNIARGFLEYPRCSGFSAIVVPIRETLVDNRRLFDVPGVDYPFLEYLFGNWKDDSEYDIPLRIELGREGEKYRVMVHYASYSLNGVGGIKAVGYTVPREEMRFLFFALDYYGCGSWDRGKNGGKDIPPPGSEFLAPAPSPRGSR